MSTFHRSLQDEKAQELWGRSGKEREIEEFNLSWEFPGHPKPTPA